MKNNGILVITIVLSVAMIVSTMLVSYDIHAEAAKPAFLWCYSTPNSPNGFLCSISHGECSMVQSADNDAKSGCFKQKNGS